MAVSAAAFVALRDDGADAEMPSERTLASLVSAAKDGEPVRDLGGTDGGLEVACYMDLPAILPDGNTSPELAAFPARVLGQDFELRAIRLRQGCEDAAANTLRLDTHWVYTPTGKELSIGQLAASGADARISAHYASFSEGGYEFWVMVLPTGRFGAEQDEPSLRRETILAGLRGLNPTLPMNCFSRNELKDWSDLDTYGIGDPRPSVPDSLRLVSLEFTAFEGPAGNDCPSPNPARSGEPEVSINAVFNDGANGMLSLNAVSRAPGDDRSASFQPGNAVWFDERYAYSINWHPELVSEADIRQIASLIDPKFDSVCAVIGKQVPFEALAPFGVLQPTLGGSATYLDGPPQFWETSMSVACGATNAGGFFAHWTMQLEGRPGLIDVFALFGPQPPATTPYFDEERSIYWKSNTGVEFYVAGIKAPFERTTLYEVGRTLDPQFEESQLSTPIAP